MDSLICSTSVAEIAEMPLYNVTCGDIGTKPDEVETYLEGVLTLGKTWNCGKWHYLDSDYAIQCSSTLKAVLLLDEADMFLEERTLSDLDRNSLVSGELRRPGFQITLN